jgi:hypothetical protein
MAILFHKNGEFWSDQQVRLSKNSSVQPEQWRYSDSYPDFITWVQSNPARQAQWQHAIAERTDWFANNSERVRTHLPPLALLFMEWATCAGATANWVNQLDW